MQLQQGLLNLMMNSIDAMKDVDGTREFTVQSQGSAARLHVEVFHVRTLFKAKLSPDLSP